MVFCVIVVNFALSHSTSVTSAPSTCMHFVVKALGLMVSSKPDAVNHVVVPLIRLIPRCWCLGMVGSVWRGYGMVQNGRELFGMIVGDME